MTTCRRKFLESAIHNTIEIFESSFLLEIFYFFWISEKNIPVSEHSIGRNHDKSSSIFTHTCFLHNIVHHLFIVNSLFLEIGKTFCESVNFITYM